MSRWILILLSLLCVITPAAAIEIDPPQVPDSGAEYMPKEHETFGQGLMEILSDAIELVHPELKEASKTCVCVIASVLVLSLVQNFSGSVKIAADLSGTIAIAGILLGSANTMARLGVSTIQEIGDYGKLLVPVMATALAAQGGVTASSALYAGTILFNTLLTSLIGIILIPMLYLYLAMSCANSAIGEDPLKKMRDLLKWLITWSLKILLYVFVGYMGVTGVVSGNTDASALKAAKITISGVVPVVGGILSDASEAVLISAGLVKNAAGIYGMLAILAVCLQPFVKIGVHYLMLKTTSAICGVFGTKRSSSLISDFTSGMGMILAMTASVCLMLLISTVCFMKGVG